MRTRFYRRCRIAALIVTIVVIVAIRIRVGSAYLELSVYVGFPGLEEVSTVSTSCGLLTLYSSRWTPNASLDGKKAEQVHWGTSDMLVIECCKIDRCGRVTREWAALIRIWPPALS